MHFEEVRIDQQKHTSEYMWPWENITIAIICIIRQNTLSIYRWH